MKKLFLFLTIIACSTQISTSDTGSIAPSTGSEDSFNWLAIEIPSDRQLEQEQPKKLNLRVWITVVGFLCSACITCPVLLQHNHPANTAPFNHAYGTIGNQTTNWTTLPTSLTLPNLP